MLVEGEVRLERPPRDLLDLERTSERDAVLFPVGNGPLLDTKRLRELLLRAEMSNSDSLFHPLKLQAYLCAVNRQPCLGTIYHPNSMGWRKKLEDLMQARGENQPDLARALGITQQSVSDLITGESKFPKVVNALKICNHYKVRPEWFILDQGPKVASGQLSPEEEELMALFRRISPAGQVYLLAKAKDLLNSEGSGPLPGLPDPPKVRPKPHSPH